MAEVLDSLIARHAPLAHGSEVAWCLWGALQFDIKLTAAAAAHVSKMTDNVVALLALDAENQDLFPNGTLDQGPWTSIVSAASSATEENWLLAYESRVHGWLAPSPITNHPFFAALRAADISFYDTSRRPVGFTAASLAAPGGTLPGGYV